MIGRVTNYKIAQKNANINNIILNAYSMTQDLNIYT